MSPVYKTLMSASSLENTKCTVKTEDNLQQLLIIATVFIITSHRLIIHEKNISLDSKIEPINMSDSWLGVVVCGAHVAIILLN